MMWRVTPLLVMFVITGCVSTQEHPVVNDLDQARFDVFVLGRAQDGGVPHVGCEKPCCTAARAAGQVETPACLGIHDTVTGRLVLIEATPGIERQLSDLWELAGVSGRGRQPVDAVLVTHAHIGHYTGLMHFGREVAGTRSLPLFVTPRMATFLQENGPWSELVDGEFVDLQIITPTPPGTTGDPFSPIDGLTVEAIAVPHRDEFSDTVAFRITGPARTLLFCPDIDRWGAHDGLLESLLEGVDVAYLDATFYDGSELPGRDLTKIPHPLMTDTMARLSDEAAANPGAIRFIHLNHTNPALHDSGLQREIKSRGFDVASPLERTRI
jgi:pyrroloquinoline quinone biosynthesis protein B